MGKPRLKITFAQDTNVFYAGSTVEGNVEVRVEEEIQVKAITLLCRGMATVWVYDGEQDISRQESYATPPVLLSGGSRGDSNVKLPPGVYTFPFVVKIPSEWPSSIDLVPQQFEVAYHFTCKLECSSKLFNAVEKTKQNFVVIHYFDCKSRPEWELRVRTNGQMNKCCCFCYRTVPIIANLTLERQSFLPGETIKFDAKIWNNADKEMKVYVSLKMVMMKYASDTPATTTIRINIIIGQPVCPSDDDQWTGELEVPPLPPSCVEGCSIIDRKYFVELMVLPPDPSSCLRVPVEVFIGSLPRRPAGEPVTPGNSSILVIGAAEYFMAQDYATEDRPISSIEVFVVGTERMLTECPLIVKLLSGANITNIRWKSSVTPIG